jgi:ABC-type dipeptide/oligopeptide/nickel transport system ATPase component
MKRWCVHLNTSSQERHIILQARHLWRIVNHEKVIVNDISLAVRRGETLALVGPSGAGKSSFLRLLNRLDEPSSMRTNSLALNRFRAEIEAHVGQIEAGLALGAPPSAVIERSVTTTVHASIIPTVDTLRSLGIVFIPGLASGMLLAGANPIYAAEYQFATMAMLFAASTLTGLIAGLMLRPTVFSPAEQLTLRPPAQAQA